MIDNCPSDPFVGAMQHLRGAMLVYYASEMGLSHDIEFHEHFRWYVVETDERKGTDLVHRLALKGCVDIHVHTIDPVSADLIEFSHPGLFRVCRNRFEP